MVDNKVQGGADTVSSVETLFDILEHIHQEEGATVSEVAAELNYSKSTVHRHLLTLKQRGYVVENDGYYVGFRFLEFGEQARNRHLGYQLARQAVEELANETNERAQFIVEEHGHAVYVHISDGEYAVQTNPQIGRRAPIYAVAAGKAILASLPEEELSRIFERISLEEQTNRTITDLDVLCKSLEQINDRGFALNNQEYISGLSAIGVPVTGAGGTVIGALSISGPSHRLTDDRLEDEFSKLLLGTANELELNILHS